MNGRERFLYVMATLLAVAATWMVHEFAHWSMATMLGNSMVMTLNTCYPVSGKYLQGWHETIISAAGPIITVLQAFIFYRLIRKNHNKFLFPFLLTSLYMRTLAGIMNVINLNDEGRISKAIGLTPGVLPALVIGFLFYLVYRTVKQQQYKTSPVTSTILLIMLFSSMLILGDQMLKVVLIKPN